LSSWEEHPSLAPLQNPPPPKNRSIRILFLGENCSRFRFFPFFLVYGRRFLWSSPNPLYSFRRRVMLATLKFRHRPSAYSYDFSFFVCCKSWELCLISDLFCRPEAFFHFTNPFLVMGRFTGLGLFSLWGRPNPPPPLRSPPPGFHYTLSWVYPLSPQAEVLLSLSFLISLTKENLPLPLK